MAGHSTHYTCNTGCFPLCEMCWRDIGPKERLPYYRIMWESWQTMGDDDEYEQNWDYIEAAVNEGK